MRIAGGCRNLIIQHSPGDWVRPDLNYPRIAGSRPLIPDSYANRYQQDEDFRESRGLRHRIEPGADSVFRCKASSRSRVSSVLPSLMQIISQGCRLQGSLRVSIAGETALRSLTLGRHQHSTIHHNHRIGGQKYGRKWGNFGCHWPSIQRPIPLAARLPPGSSVCARLYQMLYKIEWYLAKGLSPGKLTFPSPSWAHCKHHASLWKAEITHQ